MTKDQSFSAKIGRSSRKNDLLRQRDEVVVKVSVGTITALLKDFHSAGWDDATNEKSIFDTVFGK